MSPWLRSRVRSMRQGSTGLMRYSFVNLPAGATLTAAAGARRYGLRAR